jgi:exopolyphosphatase / guanosine-5'-triphosphate,3'-diphosphate pyrophosphatase
LFEEYNRNNPPSFEELYHVEHEISRIIKPFTSDLPNNFKAFCLSGTPTTLACLIKNQREFYDELVDNSILDVKEIEGIRNILSRLNVSEIPELYGSVVHGRADLILTGTVILLQIMKILSLQKIVISSKGLRYGAIWEYLIKNKLFIVT